MISSPFKLIETTLTKIIFQTKYPWAICLNASANGKLGQYFLANNSLNQKKISQIIPNYQSLFPPPNSKINLPQLRNYQQEDVKFLNQLKSVAIFSEMRTGKTPIALKTFQNWPTTNLLIVVPAILQQYWQEINEQFWNSKQTSQLVFNTIELNQVNWSEMEEHTNWSILHPNFTNELIFFWQNQHFTAQQCKEWLDIGINSTDFNFTTWLRDTKNYAPESVLKHSNLEQLSQDCLLTRTTTNSNRTTS